MAPSHSMARPQSGAALVVGMLLLLVLTLLAVSGMNSASLELTMAGNTQLQQRAFQMTEQGIEAAILTKANFYNGNQLVNNQNPACTGGVISNGQTKSCEKYTVTLTSLATADNPCTATFTSGGSNLTKFSDDPWEVSSVGTSGPTTKTTHIQIVTVTTQCQQ